MRKAAVVVLCLLAVGSATLYFGWDSLQKRQAKAAVAELRRVGGASMRAVLEGRVLLDCEDPTSLEEVSMVPGEGLLSDLKRNPQIEVTFSCEGGLVVIDRRHGYRWVDGYFEETGGLVRVEHSADENR